MPIQVDPPWRTAAADTQMVDATRARNHVRQLVDGRMTRQAIAENAGISASAVRILLHGQYSPGRPAQKTIRRGVERRILAVELEPRRTAEPWCSSSANFEPAGYRVGRCANCGEITWARIANKPGDQVRLIAHPTRFDEDEAKGGGGNG